jgi:hypothetical protein
MSILDRKRFGLILRGFSKSSEQVAKNVEAITKAAEAASQLTIGGKHVFSSIQVLIAADKSRIDYDCGETGPALKRTLKDMGIRSAEVHEVQNGDLFCGVLNYGTSFLLRRSIDYVGILSHGAVDYLTADNMSGMLAAFENGARATGLAIEELQPSILAGRLANTLAFWDAIALMSVGGFDLRAAQPALSDKTAPYMRGNGSDLYYPLAGVEEIIPLIRLTATHGKCIAPIMPTGQAQWKAPDPVADPEGAARHHKKMGTKFERQAALAASVGADLSYLQYGVMEQYARH